MGFNFKQVTKNHKKLPNRSYFVLTCVYVTSSQLSGQLHERPFNIPGSQSSEARADIEPWEGNWYQNSAQWIDFLSHLWCQLGREVGSCHTWCRCLQSTAGRRKDSMLMFDLSFCYLWKSFSDKFLRQGWVIIDNATALLQHRPEINLSMEKEQMGNFWK